MVENVIKIDKVTVRDREEQYQGINQHEGNLFHPRTFPLELKDYPILEEVVIGTGSIKETLKSQCTVKGAENFGVHNEESHVDCHAGVRHGENGKDPTLKSDKQELFARIRDSKFPVVLIKKLDSSENANVAQNFAGVPEGGLPAASTSSMNEEVAVVKMKLKCDLPVKLEALNADAVEGHTTRQPESNLPTNRVDTVTFRCYQCNFVTNSKASLKTHALIHSDTPAKFFKCSECNFETNWRYNFKNHSELHTATSGFKCSECDFESTWKDKFDYHLLIHSNPIMFKCSECDFESNWRTDFEKHMEIHSGTKRFKCAECEFETNWKNEFVYHLLIHTSTKLFKCAECGFKTSRKGNLTRHLLIHANTLPKRFKCPECEFSTHWNYKLTAHMLTHSDSVLKLFKCSVCSFETNRKGNLTRHLLIHSNATKRLKCTECNFKTHWNYKLTAHMLKHSRGVFDCSKCVYKATSKSDLKNHSSQHFLSNSVG